MAIASTLSFYRGEHAAINFTMLPVVDITDWTIVMTVAKSKNSSSKTLTLSPTILSGPAGTFMFELDTTQLDLSPATYYFDVWRMDAGHEELISDGPWIIMPDVRMPAVVAVP